MHVPEQHSPLDWHAPVPTQHRPCSHAPEQHAPALVQLAPAALQQLHTEKLVPSAAQVWTPSVPLAHSHARVSFGVQRASGSSLQPIARTTIDVHTQRMA